MAVGSGFRSRNSPLLCCADQFRADIKSTTGILAELRKYRIELQPGAHVRLGNRKVETFISLHFLKLYLSWESFLESTFLRYICGHSSPSGYSPSLLNPKHRCIDDALSNVLGRRRYLVWSMDETVRRAQAHLHMGDPYSSAISAANYDLENISIIRNRIAHRSQYARSMFRQVVRMELGHNPRAVTPGRLLITRRYVPGTRKKGTYLDYYLTVFESLCNHIVP